MAEALVEAVNDDHERRRRGARAYEVARGSLLLAGARARAGATVYDEVARPGARRPRARIR